MKQTREINQLKHLMIAVCLFLLGVILDVIAVSTSVNSNSGLYSTVASFLTAAALIVLAIAWSFRSWLARVPFFLVVLIFGGLIILVKVNEAQAINPEDISGMLNPNYDLNLSLFDLIKSLIFPVQVLAGTAFCVRMFFVVKKLWKGQQVNI